MYRGNSEYRNELYIMDSNEEADRFVEKARKIEGLEDVERKEEISRGNRGFISRRYIREAMVGMGAAYSWPHVWAERSNCISTDYEVSLDEVEFVRVID